MFGCVVGREEYCKQISLVCGKCLLYTDHLGFAPAHSSVCFLGLHSSGSRVLCGAFSKRALCFIHFPCLSYSGSGSLVLRAQTWLSQCFGPFPGPSSSDDQVLGECTVPGGPCILITSMARPLSFPGVPREHRLRCAMCLLWGADFRLRPSWQMSIIQDPRKTWLATGSLLTVWSRMPVSGAEIGAAPCLPALTVTYLPLCSGRGRGLNAAS